MMNEISINEKIFNYAKALKFGELHFKLDETTGLLAIIAIHSTKLGPALGGCRCREYDSISDAIEDAMRLAYGMTYKAAITGLPLGGGKSVLIKPKEIKDRDKYFQSFGKFIDDLNGRYITAVDSGTNPNDMDSIAKQTPFVTSQGSLNGDPSPFTADGVFLAIKAAVKHKLKREDIKGLKFAIQGVGNVGYLLARHLHKAGAVLFVTDTNKLAVEKCVKEFNATPVELDEIYQVDCDIFSPCALGAILNDNSISKLKASMVIGSANNQLAEPRHGDELHKRGILYGPDYVINAGGLIHACSQFYKTPLAEVRKQVEGIYDTTLAILNRADKQNLPTYLVADEIAEERLYAKKFNNDIKNELFDQAV